MTTHNIALLGAGGFAVKAHLPAIAATDSLRLVAVYSRSLSSVKSFVEASKQHSSTSHDLDVYSEDPSSRGLDELLAREDIRTVVLALPITTQPEIIRKALAAGKNVISEKPIAPSLAEATSLISLYERDYAPKGQQWIIAEQFACAQSYDKAKELIAEGKIGEVRTFQAEVYIQPSVQASNTGWRAVPDYQGGYCLDGGVHFIAGVRHILPFPITHISASATQIQPHLPPVDTLSGLLRATPPSSLSPSHDNAPTSIPGTFTFSFGTEKPSDEKKYVFRGSKGKLEVDWAGARTHVITLTNYASVTSPALGDKRPLPGSAAEEKGPEEEEPRVVKIELPAQGVQDEFGLFGPALVAGAGSKEAEDVRERCGPRATLRDLAFIEGGLRSSEERREIGLREIIGEELWEL